ncbi:hypothetical protein ACQW02_16500 [Humitalea sp. 24SJ18S-53]|uniref:hypothetical protein n=1 Tax=Humitalea sp. 24SJ18S-53 TaxID=3422307 RepID=UPI003D66D58A
MAPILRTLLLAGLAGPALAQSDTPPACGPATRGQVTCMAQRLCSCGYVQGGSLTGVPSGWAWDCGVLRPNCAPVPAPQASQPMPDVYLPPIVPRWPNPPRGDQGPVGGDGWPLDDRRRDDGWPDTRPLNRPPLPGPAPLTPRPLRP